VHQDSNFIEEGSVPADAKVIGYTWKHPNKKGGPDRRFSSNYRIPVCCYEAMHLTSDSGVNELLQFSRAGVTEPFARALRSLPEQSKNAPQLEGDLLLSNLSARLANLTVQP
jgi:hypothetical protein